MMPPRGYQRANYQRELRERREYERLLKLERIKMEQRPNQAAKSYWERQALGQMNSFNNLTQ